MSAKKTVGDTVRLRISTGSRTSMLLKTGSLVVCLSLPLTGCQKEQIPKPREGYPVDLYDLERRLHGARASWCRLWVDKDEIDDCIRTSLEEFRRKVNE